MSYPLTGQLGFCMHWHACIQLDVVFSLIAVQGGTLESRGTSVFPHPAKLCDAVFVGPCVYC